MHAGTDHRRARIYQVIAAIPPGRVASYGQVASLAGIGRGARLVGRALRDAPDELALPWHRVLRANGQLALAPESPARREQCRRLARESVPVIGGRVDMQRYAWQPDLDELIWGPVAAPWARDDSRDRAGEP